MGETELQKYFSHLGLNDDSVVVADGDMDDSVIIEEEFTVEEETCDGETINNTTVDETDLCKQTANMSILDNTESHDTSCYGSSDISHDQNDSVLLQENPNDSGNHDNIPDSKNIESQQQNHDDVDTIPITEEQTLGTELHSAENTADDVAADGQIQRCSNSPSSEGMEDSVVSVTESSDAVESREATENDENCSVVVPPLESTTGDAVNSKPVEDVLSNTREQDSTEKLVHGAAAIEAEKGHKEAESRVLTSSESTRKITSTPKNRNDTAESVCNTEDRAKEGSSSRKKKRNRRSSRQSQEKEESEGNQSPQKRGTPSREGRKSYTKLGDLAAASEKTQLNDMLKKLFTNDGEKEQGTEEQDKLHQKKLDAVPDHMMMRTGKVGMAKFDWLIGVM